MSYLTVYLTVLLCLTLTKLITGLDQITIEKIEGNVQIINSNHDYIKTVQLYNLAEIDIYHPGSIDKLNAFYVAVSCKFTEWTITRMYKLIEYCPLVFRREFEKDPWYNLRIKPVIKKNVSLLIDDLKKYTKRFIILLKSILHLKFNTSYYYDTTILKILLLIKTKFHFITPTVFENLNTDIVQSVLKEIVELQGFLLTNCLVLPSSKTDSQFYDFPINIVDKNNSDINEFITKLQYIGLAVDESLLFFKKNVFLESFVTIGSDDPIKSDILNAKITGNGNGSVTLRAVLMNDVAAVFTLRNSILDVVMKLIITKILTIINNGEINYDKILKEINLIKQKIKKISDMPENKNMRLSEYFVGGFVHLSIFFLEKNNARKNEAIRKLKDYVDQLCGIELGEDVPKINMTTNDEDYVYTMLNMINKELDVFEHFQDSLEILQEAREKYYAPFVKSNSTYLLPKTGTEYESCVFALNVYQLCEQALFYYNKCCSNRNEKSKMNAENVFYLKSSIKTFTSIEKYTVMVIDMGFRGLDLLKMSYNIAILLANVPIKYETGSRVFEMRRISNFIRNELNKYTLKNCAPPSFNLLPFNNVNFMNFGYNFDLKNSMNKFVRIFDVDNLDFFGISKEKRYPFLDMNYLYNTYVDKDNIFDFYGDKIKIFWKGEIMNFKKILNNLLMYTIDPYILHAFYDMYFKFFIAVFYYEISKAVIEVESKNNDAKIQMIKSYLLFPPNFQYNFFPPEFHYFINDIISVVTELNMEMVENSFTNSKKKKKIDQQFKKFNINFIDKPLVCDIKFRLKRRLDYKEVIHNITDSLKGLQQVYRHFLTFNPISI